MINPFILFTAFEYYNYYLSAYGAYVIAKRTHTTLKYTNKFVSKVSSYFTKTGDQKIKELIKNNPDKISEWNLL
jgi:hypothetical protein